MPSKTKHKPAAARTHNHASAFPTGISDTKPKDQISSDSSIAETHSQGSKLPHHQNSHASAKPTLLPPDSETTDQNGVMPTVNRKKQKRRLKEAAKKAATETDQAGSSMDGSLAYTNNDSSSHQHDSAEGTQRSVRSHNTMDDGHLPAAGEYDEANHNYIIQEPPGGTKRKAKKRDQLGDDAAFATGHASTNRSRSYITRQSLPPPAVPSTHSPTVAHFAREGHKDRIWNTSTAEERERIKEFWLGLAESDRRGLVRIEKEAVLKKMKEQQKHSCSCTVCGRKRTAIEEELEVLYDAYYDELETYANHQHFGLDATSLPPPRSNNRPRMLRPPNPPSRPRRAGFSPSGFVEEFDENDEDNYSEEEDDDDEDLSDEELDSPIAPSGGIFNFGNSLTAQGGILTVADDLLKNDGKKFIEMMEQLAERRMQREEESRMVASGMGHPSMRHPPEEEDEDVYGDEEEEDEYNSEEEDEFEDDEMEAMSEEQRMEEGRRMFQIFAARMFEQRVLNAYRQKVAEERQQKLIEELAEDEKLDAQKEAKRAKEAQKKKEKRQKQKLVKDEEKAKRDAEKAAEEAAAKELEEKKAEEQRLKKETQRRKKEAEKKAADDERKRKEDEKQRQARERREMQAEVERKQKALKEQEKKRKEEAKAKEREEREAREREKNGTPAGITVKPLLIRQGEQSASKAPTIAKQPSTANVATLATPSTLHPPHPLSAHASPRLQIATPAVPKPPTPGKLRKRSVHDSKNPSPKLSQAFSSSTASPTTSSEPNGPAQSNHSRKASQTNARPQPTQPSRFSPINAPPGLLSHPPGLSGPNLGLANGFSSHFHGPATAPIGQGHPPSFSPGLHDPSSGASQFRRPSIPYPPGIHPSRPYHSSPQGPIGSQLSYGPDNASKSRYNDSSDRNGLLHSRSDSMSSNLSPREVLQHPAPIQRPSSVAPNQQHDTDGSSGPDVDDLGRHLGSSVLIDDTDDTPVASAIDDLRRGSIPVGNSRPTGSGPIGSGPAFAPIGMGTRTEGGLQSSQQMWGNPQAPFGPPGLHSQPFMHAPGFGRPVQGNNTFGSPQTTSRPGPQRLNRCRVLVCEACDRMSHYNPMSQGWHLANTVINEVHGSLPRGELPLSLFEVLSACDVEGNSTNGGGHFEFRGGEHTGFLIKHLPANDISPVNRGHPPLGEIGNSVPGSIPLKSPANGTLSGFVMQGGLGGPGF